MFALLSGLALAACTPVHGPLVLAGDLAAADPRFAVAPPEATAGFSPAPGSRRVFSESEVDRLGKRLGVEGKAHELCFEFAMRKLPGEDVLAAMGKAIPGAEFELVETSNFNVPEGPLTFARAALPKPPQSRPEDAVVWRGSIQYAEGRKFAVWAKVRVSVVARRVIAIRDITAGREITAADVEARDGKFFPDSERWAVAAEEVVGRKALTSVRAGSVLRANALLAGREMIARGDTVVVAVDAGAAHLSIESRAETGGGLGDVVKLRNPKSGKVFEARVTGKGLAAVRSTETAAKEK